MTAKLLAPLRESPAALPQLGAIALLIAWAANEGGYPVTHWAPGAIIVLALLATAMITLGANLVSLSRSSKVALGCLFAYAAWSYASIIWAQAPGRAFEGGDRALLYALVFALFCGWPLAPRAAAMVLCVWIFALTGLAIYVLLHLNGLDSKALVGAMPGGRLDFPAGYVNAAAAQWMITAFAALVLARSERLHALIRAALAASAVMLIDVALLSLSRGSLLATAFLLVLVLVFLPGRIRSFVVLVPIAAGTAIAIAALLKVGERIEAGDLTAAANSLAGATWIAFAGALVAACLMAVLAWADCHPGLAGDRRGRVRRWLAIVAIASAAAVAAGAVAVTGNPVKKVEHAWNSFASAKGYEANNRGTNRLLSGLGSNRYDFYRVAFKQFLASPLLGSGSENYEQQYLRSGRSDETPRYPHSIELRTLAESGLVGVLIAIAGLVAALISAMVVVRGRARQSSRFAGQVAAAALVGFGYWLIHGSADWFWEYSGLGATAFALLGLACGLDRDGTQHRAAPAKAFRIRSLRGSVSALGGAVCLLVLAAALALPWLSAVEIQRAAEIWRAAPMQAYARLRSAASLDPWSDQPMLVAGTIALRENELARASGFFRAALRRDAHEQYAVLESGAIASQLGENTRAIDFFERARRLSPRDPLAAEALHIVVEGRRVSVDALNALLFAKAKEFQ